MTGERSGGSGGGHVAGSRPLGVSLRGGEMACLIPNVSVAVGRAFYFSSRSIFVRCYYLFPVIVGVAR